MDQCKENFPFQWKHDLITYLGIQITSKLSDLYTKNYLPLLNKLTSDLKTWSKQIFSWFGRAPILKMNALPRLLYLLQTIPIQIPPSFFITYRQICSKFFWGEHRHRISYNQLTLPKNLGGIGLPNLLNYHPATHLARIMDWNVHTQQKDWVSLETSFTKLPLSSLPWISSNQIPPEICLHQTIGPTIQCFHQMCKYTSISSTPSPLTPIKLNPDFPPGMQHQYLSDNWPQDQIRAHQFYHQGRLLSAAQIAGRLEKTPFPHWHI